MAAEKSSVETRSPSAVNSMTADFVYRTLPGWRLARPLEISSGSMGRRGRADRRSWPAPGPRGPAPLRADEVRHVGNVDPEPPMPVVELFQRDRVVEIPRVHRIDGHDRLGGEIGAVADRFVERFGLLDGLRPRRLRRNLSGRLNSRMIESVSTPGFPRGPSTSVMTPSPS